VFTFPVQNSAAEQLHPLAKHGQLIQPRHTHHFSTIVQRQSYCFCDIGDPADRSAIAQGVSEPAQLKESQAIVSEMVVLTFLSNVEVKRAPIRQTHRAAHIERIMLLQIAAVPPKVAHQILTIDVHG